ncbi:hypothetical protein [Streptomyces sp. DH37]|uniref:hypothetical protein n=1 Tax=Streptomyces sp. DH37 TaxID=3040122 RepID=UPI0024433306|nr:hypothetical protein [Streptomyces sp. DH37]MDG9702561.1 hypothetical protein [Streptomyces sp. DH37]
MSVMRARARSAVLATAVTMLCTGALAAGPARAEPLALLQCQGTESVAYSPGVTFQPQDIDVTTDGHLGSCVDGAGEVTSGAYGERFALHAGCNDLLGGFRGLRTFTWSTGDTSVVEAEGSSTAVAGQVVTTLTGTVVQGRFQGRSATQVITLPQPGLLLCLTTGVTGAAGVTTLTVV